LEDLLVVDLSRVLAGPFATMYMADMGARVIKIERPGKGDDTRGYGPPFVEGESTYFMSINRGKKSVVIDLKKPAGLALVHRLVDQADVLVENFRPGTAERLKLGYDQLAERNPRLIYVSVSGFGQRGAPEYANRPGYDLLAQGLSGVQALTGDPGGPPTRVGVAVGDLVAGIYALTGTLTALLVRQKTGRGQHVDVSLLDTLVSLLSYQAGIALNGGGDGPHRMGNSHPTICPYDTFEAADGHVNIAAGNDVLFQKLADAIDRPDLAEDPRFETNSNRVRHREALYRELEPIIEARTIAEWDELLHKNGVPGGPILDVTDALQHPQILARGMVRSLTHPTAGPIRVTGFPIGLSESKCGPESPPPRLGEHTYSVLMDLLNLTDEQLRSLTSEKAIAEMEPET
jgi:formyl-CoA transferase/CoA:oxalate CoA-transferase